MSDPAGPAPGEATPTTPTAPGRWPRVAGAVAAALAAAAISAAVAYHGLSVSYVADLPAVPDLTGQPEAMVKQVREADAAARSAPLTSATGELAFVYHANLHLAEALRCYDLMIEREPQDWHYRYLRARVLSDLGDIEAAAAGFADAVRLSPTLAIGWFRLGDASLKLARYEAAEAAYQRAQAVLPSPPAGGAFLGSHSEAEPLPLAVYARHGEATALLRRGKAEAALQIAEGLAKDYPSFGPAFALMEEVYLLQARKADAERCNKLAWGAVAYLPPPDPMEQVIRGISTNSAYLLYAADVAKRSAENEEAARAAERAAAVDPTHVETLVHAGQVLFDLNYPADAVSYYERARQLKPDDVEAQCGLALSLIRMGETAQGLAVMRLAAERQPSEPAIHYNYGLAILSAARTADDYAAAEKELRRALELGFANVGLVYRFLGTSLNARQQWEEAEKAFKAGLAVQENDWSLRGELAKTYLGMKQPARAIEQWRMVLAYVPRDAGTLFALATELDRLGRKQEAEAVARQWATSAPRDANAHLFYAQIAAGMGEKRTAVYHAQIAVQLVPDQPVARERLAACLALPDETVVAPASRGGAATAPAPALPPSPERGAALYRTWCAACHSTTEARSIGPTFQGLFGRDREFTDGTHAAADEAYLRQSIREPQAKTVKGYQPLMPQVRLADDEVESLIAFIKAIGK